MTTVLVDGYALSDASHQRGIGTYLRRVLAGVQDYPDMQVKVLAPSQARLPSTVQRVNARQLAPGRFRDLEHELALPWQLRSAGYDVFHSPAQHPPRRCAVPWIQTLHDLTPLTWPHPLLERERRRWVQVGPRLRRAAAVVAVSQFSASEGIRRLGLDPSKIEVIPLGVDGAVFRPADEAAREEPYVLHVAAWGPHKGFAEALAVIGLLADAGLPHRLLLAGPNDAWMQGQIRASLMASPRPDRAQIAGYVEDLASLYRGAQALLMTSRSEGFGLPALEAMACGTPVVAFSNSSLPEVIGDGGVLVPDGDVQAMAKAVRRLHDEPHATAELIERGLARAQRFRWEDTVRAHAELLRSVTG